jgi:outer membrane lipoprotein-sorting protein
MTPETLRRQAGRHRRRTPFTVALLAFTFVAFPVNAATKAQQASVEEILARLDRAQQEIESFRAHVRETRELALLAEPETLEGELIYREPGEIRWEYSEPERRVYVLSDGTLTGWLPNENRAERLDVSRSARRVERIVAIGQDSEELERSFRVRVGERAEIDEDLQDTDMLVLEPKSRRVRRRVEEVRLWIGRESGLPRQVRYVTGDGDTVTLEMTDFVVNPELPEGIFGLEIPPEADIVEGLSSLGFGDDDASR